jgi:hypothetical protein
MRWWLQVALQLWALPVAVSTVQASPSSQALGQLDGGSQVSPPSIRPFPQPDPPTTTLVSSDSLVAPSPQSAATAT